MLVALVIIRTGYSIDGDFKSPSQTSNPNPTTSPIPHNITDFLKNRSHKIGGVVVPPKNPDSKPSPQDQNSTKEHTSSIPSQHEEQKQPGPEGTASTIPPKKKPSFLKQSWNSFHTTALKPIHENVLKPIGAAFTRHISTPLKNKYPILNAASKETVENFLKNNVNTNASWEEFSQEYKNLNDYWGYAYKNQALYVQVVKNIFTKKLESPECKEHSQDQSFINIIQMINKRINTIDQINNKTATSINQDLDSLSHIVDAALEASKKTAKQKQRKKPVSNNPQMTKATARTTLGLNKGATQEEIKKAYRALARKWHPDKNANPEEATEKFNLISAAHALLTKTNKTGKHLKKRLPVLTSNFI